MDQGDTTPRPADRAANVRPAQGARAILAQLREDVAVIFERDPAARSLWEVAFTYPGLHAILSHRVSHVLWQRGLKTLARIMSHVSRFFTGIEIHPGAVIGQRFFIDHGMGVVIGETSMIGDDVTIYQGVSLGGTNLGRGKRHPTIEDGVVVGADATVLGPVSIGRESRIGAGSVVVDDVPANSTVVGIPGRVVEREEGWRDPTAQRISLDHANLPDPMAHAIVTLLDRVHRLEHDLARLRSRDEVRPAGTGGAAPGGTTSAEEGSRADPADPKDTKSLRRSA
jgi:serine O-acetyltransferase